MSEERDELGYLLAEMLHTEGWRHVAVPSLRKMLHDVSHKLAIGRNLEMPEIRALQTRYEVIGELLQRPGKFFGVSLKGIE